jgi:pimeloyl-ACP methyl ester carboxylesterase
MIPTLGKNADRVAGFLSRALHLRSTAQNTVGDLEPYFGLEVDAAFPPPAPVRDFDLTRTFFDRAIDASTLSWTSAHVPLSPAYRARHRHDYPENLRAWARWVRPEGRRRRDCLVYVHGWLEPGSWAEETTLFRKWGRELDVDLVHLTLPFHGRRTPRGSLFPGELFWTADLVRSAEGVRQAVCDARSLIAYLRAEGYERVGVTGLSLGGAVCMVLACVTPGPDFAAPMMAHLELEAAVEHAPILWRMKRDLAAWGVDEARRRAIFGKLGWSRYRPALAPERQLWVEAEDDGYIDAELVKKQWRAWGTPPLLWVPGGHMTFPLAVPKITERLAAFIRDSR